MNRIVILMTIACLAVSMNGCQSCKHLFGLDRRCEQQPPPQSYAAPVNYVPMQGSCAAPATCAPR